MRSSIKEENILYDKKIMIIPPPVPVKKKLGRMESKRI